ncbi:MAG: IPExxxVDY family protein [Flavisolibacter sp.]|jgi:hypothetical protein|nr:IPExxxVDY family protein [Flavisolibacter sp.]
MASSQNLKLVLDTHAITENFFDATRLLGIMAPVKAYQFCWKVNAALGIDFRINNDLEIQLIKKNRNYFFSIYEFNETATCLKHYLYNNQNDGEYLLPEFKHLDFLWLLKDDHVAEDYLQEIVQSLKAISGVQLVVELTNEKIKHREHLVL